ncbi:MAG: EamA family transporter RarD [Actinomycetota bacterium]
MRRGVVVALVGYVLWGLSPIFWRLGDGSAGDILVLRILSTFALLMLMQLIRDRAASVRDRLTDPRVRRMAVLSSVLLASNWLGFIWAVTSDRVLEASLGYFLNPLVSVVLGVTVLGERLRRRQWVAVAIAGVGVVALSIDVGSLPWISLFLGITFGLYGLVRKTAPVESLDGLTIEVAAVAPLAAVALGLFTADGGGVATVDGGSGWLWVAGASVMTAAPLLLFAWAARRIELWLVGVLQYLTPTLQFLLGVLAYDESWSGGQAVGYVVIWTGLVVFGAEGIAVARRRSVMAGSS